MSEVIPNLPRGYSRAALYGYDVLGAQFLEDVPIVEREGILPFISVVTHPAHRSDVRAVLLLGLKR